MTIGQLQRVLKELVEVMSCFPRYRGLIDGGGILDGVTAKQGRANGPPRIVRKTCCLIEITRIFAIIWLYFPASRERYVTQ